MRKICLACEYTKRVIINTQSNIYIYIYISEHDYLTIHQTHILEVKILNSNYISYS